MRRIYYICIYILLGVGIASCADNLDSDKYFKDRMLLEDVFTDETRTERWLAHAFSYLSGENMDVSSKDNNLFCFADDIYFGDRDDYKTFKNGTYNEGFRHSWGASYKGIRQASIFIQNVDMNMKITEQEKADFKAQARFVRAYYYWLLLRRYGPIPLLPDEGLDYTDSYEGLARQRNTYDECANYIASEMALAAKDLPLERGTNHIARPTRGAALAARAKVLLYAASPINNPRPEDTERFTDLVDHDGKCLIAQEYDEYKWAKAAAATLDVMKLGQYELHYSLAKTESSPGFPKTVTPYQDNDFSKQDWPDGYKNIDPFESYRSLFDGDLAASDNKELIFTRGKNQGDRDLADMVRHQLPSIYGGWNTHGMTQKQCDAYYMANGDDCPGKERELNIPGRSDMRERANGFVSKTEAGTEGYEHLRAGVSKQYAGREPRFYASVGFNGAIWPMLQNSSLTPAQPVDVQIFYYRGNGNGYTNTNFWLRSGIGIMKFVSPDDTAVGKINDRITKKPEPAIRYAEILLIYAEALNELEDGSTYDISSWDGSTSYSIKRDINEMKKGIRPIRCRAGVPDYDLTTVYGNKDEFRKKLKRERQIELMGEGHRYFDLRRWKDAPVEEAMKVYGCNTLMTDSEDQKVLFHSPVVINDLPSTFSRKLYFWPISHDELKRNNLLTQNPGWTYND